MGLGDGVVLKKRGQTPDVFVGQDDGLANGHRDAWGRKKTGKASVSDGATGSPVTLGLRWVWCGLKTG